MARGEGEDSGTNADSICSSLVANGLLIGEEMQPARLWETRPVHMGEA